MPNRKISRLRVGDLVAGRAVGSLYAWVACKPDGAEALVSGMLTNGWQPLIGADRWVVWGYRPHAEIAAKLSGLNVVLRTYGEGAVIDEIPAMVRLVPN